MTYKVLVTGATGDELRALEVDNITKSDTVERHFGFKPLPLNKGLSYQK